jgi:hypothetical protein
MHDVIHAARGAFVRLRLEERGTFRHASCVVPSNGIDVLGPVLRRAGIISHISLAMACRGRSLAGYASLCCSSASRASKSMQSPCKSMKGRRPTARSDEAHFRALRPEPRAALIAFSSLYLSCYERDAHSCAHHSIGPDRRAAMASFLLEAIKGVKVR